ncbi:MAG: T9SS type A sorting domain-containing protein [Bacteroidetes bacterium]|jgi:hypothetical protein|nr:T9SS type A sorting domain-containing protein [Bacteroidota bacterium]MDF1868189.1 T9SS type A sorting domain-containing protein [Saprospiraceae bacterium]
MIKKLTFFILFFFTLSISYSQILLSEDFESGSLPTGWTISTNATDGGWVFGSAGALSSSYFNIPNNGSNIAVSNDDGCNCDKSVDYLILPALDLTDAPGASIEIDVNYANALFQGVIETGTIEVSLDSMQTWEQVKTINGSVGWNHQVFDLSDYVGNPNVHIGIRYNDGGGWLYGIAIDNVVVKVPLALDAGFEKISMPPFGTVDTEYSIRGTLFNNGANEINSIELTYQDESGNPVSATIDGLNVAGFEAFTFEHPSPWIPAITGTFTIPIEITAVNGVVDGDPSNNTSSFEMEIFPNVERLNIIDDYLVSPIPVMNTMNSSGDQLDKPTDLDFFPILAKNELWVINQRTENIGGSTTTFYDVGTPEQNSWQRVDGNSWHFMSLPTAMEFGENGNWGNSPGVQDANHGGGTFTGPTLWSSDPDIYAQPSGGNGSHLDMLHGSPLSMGIAHEVDNVYWVFDSWNGEIVRYDFVEDHGPGNDDHSDGIVRRYSEIDIQRDGDIPSHMVIDKSSGWLYIVDNGNDRVLRLDINSGQMMSNLPLINEPLAEHSRYGNVTWEVIIQDGLVQPCGIEVIEDRLLVGDYATGEIIIYDIENNFEELGRLASEPGITGIKVGPTGHIWHTNRIQNTLTMLEPGDPSSTYSTELASNIFLSPNPTKGDLNIQISNSFTQEMSYKLTDLSGKTLDEATFTGNSKTLYMDDYPSGIYFLTVLGDNVFATKKVVKE